MNTFADKIAELDVERAALEHELAHAPDAEIGKLKARLASVERSLHWYQSRSRPLGITVGDDVSMQDRA